VANVKIKNNLLAITLVLTSLPPSLKVSKVVVEEICYAIGQNLSTSNERPELGMTAIHCATTLLQASLRTMPSSSSTTPVPSPILQHAALHLLTPLITFVAETVASASTGDLSNVEGVKQVVRGLVGWTSGLPDNVKARGYGVLLPTLCLLLDTGDSGASPIHLIATTTLLGLAQSAPGAFKDATQVMDPEERGRLEKAVREAVGARQSQASGGPAASAEKKVIELRSFG
jgi:hypothetical protein